MARIVLESPEKSPVLNREEWVCDSFGLGRATLYSTVTGNITSSTLFRGGTLNALAALTNSLETPTSIQSSTTQDSHIIIYTEINELTAAAQKTSESSSFPTQINSSSIALPTSLSSSSNSTEHILHSMSSKDNLNLAIGMGVGAGALIALIAGLVWQWKRWGRAK